MSVRDLLIRHEGIRLKPYRDTVGILTIGVGRNIEEVGISENESLFMLDNDINNSQSMLRHHLNPWYDQLSEPRQAVLIDMSFMGVEKLLQFKNMIQALSLGDYEQSCKEMMLSHWAAQVGKRAGELCVMMRENRFLEKGE